MSTLPSRRPNWPPPRPQELAPIVDRVRGHANVRRCLRCRLQAARDERRQAIEALQAVLDEVENGLWGCPRRPWRRRNDARLRRGGGNAESRSAKSLRRVRQVEDCRDHVDREVVYSGEQLRNQIEANRGNADADSQLGETLARMPWRSSNPSRQAWKPPELHCNLVDSRGYRRQT